MKFGFWILILLPPILLSQENHLFAAGQYQTLSDFEKKTPNENLEFRTHKLENVITVGFQLIDKNDRRIKKPFAVSNGKTLFVKVSKMQKLIRKTQKPGQPNDSGWDYIPALLLNENLLYFENYFAPIGKQIFWGKIYLTGIIYDCNEHTFTVLNSNELVNNFIANKKPELTKKYKFTGKQVDLKMLRLLVNEIIK